MIRESNESNTDQTEGREALREMLIRLQNEAQQRIKNLRRDQTQKSDSGRTDEIDSARTTGDIETHAGRIALAEEKLRQLDEAIARLDAGKYGRCLKCDGAIRIERLTAIPFASYCVDCQKGLNRVRGGWGHAPYDHQWTVPEDIEPPTERESHSAGSEENLTIREDGPRGSGQPKNKLVKRRLPKKRRGLTNRTAGPRVRS